MARRKSLGQLAYEAYGRKRGWTVVGGGKMPAWEDQTPELRAAWQAGAEAVSSAVRHRKAH